MLSRALGHKFLFIRGLSKNADAVPFCPTVILGPGTLFDPSWSPVYYRPEPVRAPLHQVTNRDRINYYIYIKYTKDC